MNSRTRAILMSLSAPVIAFAIVGGFLGKVMAGEQTYQNLKIFDDVVSMITNNYVEEVDVDKVMNGAMRGLAEGLDPDSAYLSAENVKQIEAGAELPRGDVGIDLTRQYYLRIIATRDNSPAAKAGLRSGDYVRAINDKPTREMSVWEGIRELRGAPGTKVSVTILRGNANDPHVVELTREAPPAAEVTGRIAAPGVGYVRIAAMSAKTADQVKAQVAELTKAGAGKLIVDVRRTSGGLPDDGLKVARLFVASGTLAQRESKSGKETIAAGSGDGAITAPASVLVDVGTTGADANNSAARPNRPSSNFPTAAACGFPRPATSHLAANRCTKRASSQPFLWPNRSWWNSASPPQPTTPRSRKRSSTRQSSRPRRVY